MLTAVVAESPMRAGWRVFRDELPAAITPNRFRRVGWVTVDATVAVAALLQLIPFESSPERVGFTALSALLVTGFAAGVTILVVTRADRHGFPPRGPTGMEPRAVASARVSGRYDELSDDLRQRLIDGARYNRRTVPSSVLATLVMSVPFALVGLIFFIVQLPAASFPVSLIIGTMFTVNALVTIRALSETDPIVRFADRSTETVSETRETPDDAPAT